MRLGFLIYKKIELGGDNLCSRAKIKTYKLGRQAVSTLSPVWPKAGYLTALSLNFLHLETGYDNVCMKDRGRILLVPPSNRCKRNISFLSLFLFHIQQV